MKQKRPNQKAKLTWIEEGSLLNINKDAKYSELTQEQKQILIEKITKFKL